MRARFVVMANGPLHRPKLPGIPGVETFAGHAVHTSRWDYAYTGGTCDGKLDRQHDKVVGIIGTGATAVQCVPHLGAAAKHLYVFQRTPSSIDVRNDLPTDPAWAASLQPGWQQRRMDNFNNLVSGIFEREDLVHDGWTDIIGNLLLRLQGGDTAGGTLGIPESIELADFEKMEQIRARVDAVVADPRVGEALKPYYRQFCKRPCFHDEYLQTFNRPNVTLVDTEGKGVERITPAGVVVARANAWSAYDVFVVVEAYRPFYEALRRKGRTSKPPALVSLASRWLPPTQYSLRFEEEGVHVKAAVIRADTFRRETSSGRRDHFCSGRLCQATRILHSRDEDARRHLLEGLVSAHRETWRWARPWLPPTFGASEYGLSALRTSMRWEVRPEPPGRADALWEAQRDLQFKAWLAEQGITRVEELDWWGAWASHGLAFHCLPAQHFSARSPWDGNRRLWASWALVGRDRRLYFSGDTGYFDGFRAIGERLGPFYVTALSIGAYLPPEIMKSVHTTPEEAVQAHLDLRGRVMLGIH